jgi:ornithine cyclodeaminase
VTATADDLPLWIGEQDAAALLTLPEAIDVLAGAYRLQAAGEAASMSRVHLLVGGQAILHAVGGSMAGAGVAGTKTWLYTPGGAAPLLVLFALADGRLLGVIEAFAMGQLRTAATSGLATRLLAREDASSLALVGTGKQAFTQAMAVAAVRPIDEVRVVGRDGARRGAMAERLREQLDASVLEFDDVARAVQGAAVVTTITRAAEPILSGAAISAGTHINAVGAIVPSRRELDESAIARADVIVADSVAQVREDAGELLAAAAVGALDWADVRGLDEVVDEPTGSLRGADEVTLFKAVGVGLADVALGVELLSRARAAGAGRPLPVSAVEHR